MNKAKWFGPMVVKAVVLLLVSAVLLQLTGCRLFGGGAGSRYGMAWAKGGEQKVEIILAGPVKRYAIDTEFRRKNYKLFQDVWIESFRLHQPSHSYGVAPFKIRVYDEDGALTSDYDPMTSDPRKDQLITTRSVGFNTDQSSTKKASCNSSKTQCNKRFYMEVEYFDAKSANTTKRVSSKGPYYLSVAATLMGPEACLNCPFDKPPKAPSDVSFKVSITEVPLN